jgi:acyl carrier protein
VRGEIYLLPHLLSADRKAKSLRESTAPSLGEFDYAYALQMTTSDEEAIDLVHGWFRSKVGKLLGISPDDIDMSKPAHAYGIDSLVSIDLKNWIKQKLGANMQIFNVLGNMSLQDLSRQATLQSSFDNGVRVPDIREAIFSLHRLGIDVGNSGIVVVKAGWNGGMAGIGAGDVIM